MVVVACALCKKAIERSASKLKCSKHGVYFCTRACKDKGQSIEGGIASIQPSHYGNGINNYRNKVEMKLCVGCGETRRFLLVVHHKDGNRGNNLKANLECVCHNCHALRHLNLIDGVWVYKSSALTPVWAIGIIGNTLPLHGRVYGSTP